MAQTQGLKRGWNAGPQAVVEAVTMHSDNYRISVITHVCGGEASEVRAAGSKCTTGRADVKGVPGREGWLQARIQGLPRAERASRTGDPGGGHLPTQTPVGWKLTESVRSGRQPCWSLFLSGNSPRGPLKSQTLGTPVPPVWLLHIPLFLASSACLSVVAGGWVGLDQSRSFEWCPEGLEKLVSHLTLTSTARKSLEAGGLPFGTELRQPRGRRMQETWGCSSFLFLWCFSVFSRSIGLLKSITWALPKNFLFMNSCRVIGSHEGLRLGVSFFTTLVTSLPNLTLVF